MQKVNELGVPLLIWSPNQQKRIKKQDYKIYSCFYSGTASDKHYRYLPSNENGIASRPSSSSVDEEFDSLLATRLEAYDYGMKSYVLAFLKAGDNRDLDSATASQHERAHWTIRKYLD